HVPASVVFWKCNNIADAVQSGDDRYEPVEAKSDTTVGWRTVGKCIHQETKLFLCLLRRKPEVLKHQRLQVALVYPNGSATHLYAVDDQIVCIGPHTSGITVQQRNVFRFRSGKWMVHGVVTAVFLIPLQKREVHYPQRCIHVLITKSELSGNLQPELAELLTYAVGCAGHNQ